MKKKRKMRGSDQIGERMVDGCFDPKMWGGLLAAIIVILFLIHLITQ